MPSTAVDPAITDIGCAGPVGQQFREPPLVGDFNLFLQAPCAGNDASVNVNANVPAWLEFDWDVSVPGFEYPTGAATMSGWKMRRCRVPDECAEAGRLHGNFRLLTELVAQ